MIQQWIEKYLGEHFGPMFCFAVLIVAVAWALAPLFPVVCR